MPESAAGAPVVVKDVHFMGNFVRVSVIPGDGTGSELVKVNLQTLPEGVGPVRACVLSVEPIADGISRLMRYPRKKLSE